MHSVSSRRRLIASGAGLLLAGCGGAESADVGVEVQHATGSSPTRAVQVADANPGPRSSNPGWLCNVDGTLFFAADDRGGRELWKSNGKDATLVADITPDPAGTSNPTGLTNVNGTLFFAADDGVSGIELWKSDGTATGTVLVKNINPNGGSGPGGMVDVNGTLFFTANDGTTG
jgi:ELWxxDGT repeat protein